MMKDTVWNRRVEMMESSKVCWKRGGSALGDESCKNEEGVENI